MIRKAHNNYYKQKKKLHLNFRPYRYWHFMTYQTLRYLKRKLIKPKQR